MGGAALMEESDGVAEMEPAPRPDEMRGAQSALAVLTVLLLLGGLVSAVVVDRRSGPVSIAALRSAADRVGQARSLHMSVESSFVLGDQPSQGFKVLVDVDNVTNHAHLRAEGLGTTFDMVSDGTSMYVTVPADRQASLGGKPCVVVAVSAAAQPTVPGVPTLSLADGKAVLGYLAGASGTVRDLGADKLDGLDTHKYAVDVDAAMLAKRLPEAQQPSATAFLQMTGTQVFPYTAWLDDAGQIRKALVEITSGGVKGLTTVRFDPSDQPFTVEVPAAGTCVARNDLSSVLAPPGD
jgi:hypothetical protein